MASDLRGYLHADGCPRPAGPPPAISPDLIQLQQQQQDFLEQSLKVARGQKQAVKSRKKEIKECADAANRIWFYRQVEEIKPSWLVVTILP